MRWPWRRAETPVAADEPAFDASIDVDLSHLAADERASAAAAIAAQVGALPGAGWVSVEPHLPTGGVEVRVYPSGSSQAEADEGWAGLRRRVEGVVREAVAGLSAGLGYAGGAGADRVCRGDVAVAARRAGAARHLGRRTGRAEAAAAEPGQRGG